MKDFRVGDMVCTKYPIHIEKSLFGYNAIIERYSILTVVRIYPRLEEVDVFVHHLQTCPEKDPYFYRLGFHEIELHGRREDNE